MKCPICGAENPADAASCQQCGFGFSLAQPTWPELPTLEIPGPITIQWPELATPTIEEPAVPPGPTWPQPEQASSPLPALAPAAPEPEPSPLPEWLSELTPAAPAEEPVLQAPRPTPPAPTGPTEDDQLARAHLARGLQAVREGMPDQARWEFEQARDLADDEDMIRMAEAQLRALQLQGEKQAPILPSDLADSLEEETLQEQAAPTMPAWLEHLADVPTSPGDRVERAVSTMPTRSQPTLRSASRPSTTQITPLASAIGVGLTMGVLNGVLTGCTAVFCSGILLAPLFGFMAGRLTRSQADKQNLLSGMQYAAVAGGLTGLCGWIGHLIGYPIWLSALPNADPSLASPMACVSALTYIPLSTVMGILGWTIGKRK